MSIDKALLDRSGGKCEFCGSEEEIGAYEVAPRDEAVVVCKVCRDEIEGELDESRWHCLNDTMWSEIPALKVLSYRLLTRLGNQDLVDMMYLEEDEMAWAKEGISTQSDIDVRDSNGNKLSDGDSVSIIKDLPVKGAGFTAKQGTTVKGIRLLDDDPTHIQGKVNGVSIFLKTEFLKKI